MATVTGNGTIFQLEKDKPKSKCRKWQLRVSLGKDPRTGKYQKKTRTFTGTYTQAKAAMREFIEEVEGDRVQGRTSYTFEDYCDHFIELRQANKEVAATTLLRQKTQFKAACMHLGKAKLEAITPADLNNMYIAMLKGDTLSGRPSSGSYVNQIHDNVTLVFAQAVREGILTSNPCDSANPPKSDTKPKRALSPDQVHLLIAMLDEKNPRECAYLLAITMGLRRGEVCGLSWNDIDFERRQVSITHSYDVLGNLKGTKTKAGTRLLPLADVTYDALVAQKQAQADHFASINRFRKPHEGYVEQTGETAVIATHYGKRVYPNSLSKWWTEERGKYGLEGWGLHELRHSYLTMLAMSGVHPKVMQELAGHYSSQITMDIYTHVNMDQKRQAANAVSALF